MEFDVTAKRFDIVIILNTLNNLTLILNVMLFALSATATTEKSDCRRIRNDSVSHHGLHHLDQDTEQAINTNGTRNRR